MTTTKTTALGERILSCVKSCNDAGRSCVSYLHYGRAVAKLVNDGLVVRKDGGLYLPEQTAMTQPIRPAKQIPASKPITEPVDHGQSVWGGRVLQMPPSEIQDIDEDEE